MTHVIRFLGKPVARIVSRDGKYTVYFIDAFGVLHKAGREAFDRVGDAKRYILSLVFDLNRLEEALQENQ